MHTDNSTNMNPFALCGWADDKYHYFYSQDEQTDPDHHHTPEDLMKNNCMQPSSLKSTKTWEQTTVGIPGTYTLHMVQGKQPTYFACAASCWNPDNNENKYQYPVSLYKAADPISPSAKQQLEDFGLTGDNNCLCLMMTDSKNFKDYPQLIGERGDCFAASATSNELILSLVTEKTKNGMQPFDSDVVPETFMSTACYIPNRFDKGVLSSDLCVGVPKVHEDSNFTFQDANGIFWEAQWCGKYGSGTCWRDNASTMCSNGAVPFQWRWDYPDMAETDWVSPNNDDYPGNLRPPDISSLQNVSRGVINNPDQTAQLIIEKNSAQVCPLWGNIGLCARPYPQ